MKKSFKIFIFMILFFILSVYIAGVYLFSDRFMPKTYINGIDFGLTKISELEKNYEELSKDLKVFIKAKDVKEDEYISSTDIKYDDRLIDVDDIHQIPFYWPIASLIEKDFDLKHSVDLDDNLLDLKIQNLKAVKNGNVHPEDAKVVFENGNFKIVDEIEGNIVRVDLLKKAIIDTFSKGEDTVDLGEQELYLSPNITSDSDYLKNQLKSYEDVYDRKIVYNFEDRKEEITGQKMIALFSKSENGTLVPDDEKIDSFVKTLAGKYDTFKGTREFNATDIGKVRVNGGIYGWLTDIEKTKEELANILATGEDKELTPVYKLTANSRAENDLGNSYIEVDLARQMLWFYKDGQMILKTNIVTGNPNRGNSTPTGTDKIWSREKDRYLTGENYRSKVSYWLPINWRGIGLHDATWRSSFGGSNYRTNGSHGCINIPPKDMPRLFENTFNGMPVVVYDSSTQKIS